MKIALIHKAHYPIQGYGGTERLVWWIAKGLSESGCDVTLFGEKGSECPFAKVRHDINWDAVENLKGFDLLHLFNTPKTTPSVAHLVTIGGNGKPGESYLENTVFVSRNHAERHGATCFVHNAIDPEEYVFREKKGDYLLFLAKASWRVKNVKGAIRIARAGHKKLRVVGGSRWWMPGWRGVTWEGMLSGPLKADLLASAQGLLFPVLWNEPFGLAVAESLMSGTPVLAPPFGSLPELISPEVGLLCDTEAAFVEGIGRLSEFSPARCREWAMEKFHYRRMAKDYRQLYDLVLSGKKLNPTCPRASEVLESLKSIPRLGS